LTPKNTQIPQKPGKAPPLPLPGPKKSRLAAV
jgi:hypothetical protein